MKIETKYNIGDKIWVVYEPNIKNAVTNEFEPSGEVSVYVDTIIEIVAYKNGIDYGCEYYTDGFKESDIILYEEKDKLVQKIEELMKEIHDREEKE